MTKKKQQVKKRSVNVSLVTAGIVAIALVLWLASSLIIPPAGKVDDSANAAAEEKKELAKVRVRSITAEMMTRTVRVNGRTEANRSVDVRAEIEGQMAALLVQKGDRVTEGQVIARIEPQDRAARVRETKEKLTQTEIEYNAARKLQGKGYSSKVSLAQKRSALEAARAGLEKAQIELAKTEVKAPFAGIVNDQSIELGDYVRGGDMLFSIVDLDPLEVTGALTEKQVIDIREKQTAVATFLDGSTINGVVSYIAPQANPQTRTFRIEVSVPNEKMAIVAGLTMELSLPLPSASAHKVSPSILTLADDGRIGVKAVIDDIVTFMPVQILADKTEFVWIGGLPKDITVITVGQEFVLDGQKVEPVLSNGDGML